MELTYCNPGVDYMIDSVMGFQTEGESGFWTEPLYHFYPQLDKACTQSLPFAQRKAHIGQVLRQVYREQEPVLEEKVRAYQMHWQTVKPQVAAALTEAFGVDCDAILNDMRCYVSLNPIEPRFPQERRFDSFYLQSPRGAIGSALHEIIHMVWFHVWNLEFGDDYSEYERPTMKWVLSEMVVESIMADPRLSELNPYFPRAQGGCIYPYFFDMMVEGRPILETLDELYHAMDIRAFMRRSYEYCLAHEQEIRSHIERSESAGI